MMPDPIWKAAYDIADRHDGRLRRGIYQASSETLRAIDMKQLKSSIAVGDFNRGADTVPIEEVWAVTVREAAESAFQEAFWDSFKLEAGLQDIPLEIEKALSPMRVREREAAYWAMDQAGELIREITPRTKEAIRNVLKNSYLHGWTQTRTIEMIREVIGLTEFQAKALNRFYEKRLADGVPKGKAAAMRRKKSGQMLEYRAKTISQTEAIRAVSAGQWALWKKAQGEGYLDANRRRVWGIGVKACEHICVPMAYQSVRLDEMFVTGKGSLVMFPPAHPKCQCYTRLEKAA